MTEERFGPNHKEVEAVIRRASRLTKEEVKRLSIALGRTEFTTWLAAWHAAEWSTMGADRHSSWQDVWQAAAGAAARDAAVATAVSDLVGQHGLTQEHIDTLMRPWIGVLGPDWREAVE